MKGVDIWAMEKQERLAQKSGAETFRCRDGERKSLVPVAQKQESIVYNGLDLSGYAL